MSDIGTDLHLAYENGYESGKNDATQNWISVKERLPEPGERVLYCYRGFVGEGYVSRSGDWERAGIWTFYCPSHWMPLPEPPKEGGGEG